MHPRAGSLATKTRPSRDGFSITELVAAMVSASFLLISVGLLLYYSSKGWQRSLQVVDLRRDANATLSLLAHQIRMTTYTNITVSSNTLTITPASVQASGNNLNYMPTAGTGQIALVRGNLATFVAGLTNGMVTIHLRLTNGSDAAEVYAAYKCRN